MLVRLEGKENSYSMLMGLKASSAALEISGQFSKGNK